jgi:DNA polymerase III epsilon subunit-like protein
MLINNICVFDFETDGSDPKVCSPVQLSAVMVDSQRLEIIKDSEFNVFLKPDRIAESKKPDISLYSDSDILDWHGKIKNQTREQIFDSWLKYPDQKHSWQQFTNYLDNYHAHRSRGNTQFSAPIACGYNIVRFDLKIMQRLAEKYGNLNKEKNINIFHPRDQIDLMAVTLLWFEGISEIKSLALDNLRDYLGMDKTNAHDAFKDVTDCANMLIRFMRLHRKLSNKIKFKGSFAESIL